MLTEKHLAILGITMKQANDFIIANINRPQIIFDIASQFGITSRMLSDITGYSTEIVHGYFLAAGYSSALISTKLDVSILVNSDLGTLEHLVSFNSREGVLSNAALREVVQPEINKHFDYDASFGPVKPNQAIDHIYTSGELGVSNLNNVSATNENIESIFYGSLINMFSALDETELNQINAFSENGNQADFQSLLFATLSETPEPIVWSDDELADMVTTEAIHILENYWTNDWVGILDHSYLNLAVV